MKIEELEKEIKALPVKDQARLIERLGLEKAADVLQAHIEIHDLNQRDRVKPRAIILYPDGTKEGIDIIASVRNNAVSIGHPAILLAIRRWEYIVRYYRNLIGKPAAYLRTYRPDLPFEEIHQIAINHLEHLVGALIDGVKRRALPKERLVTLFLAELGIDINHTYLLEAWRLLGESEIKSAQRNDTKIQRIRKRLSEIDPYSLRGYREGLIKPVINFLNSPSGKKWLFKRRTKSAMINDFDAWRLGLNKDTLRKYRSAGKYALIAEKFLGMELLPRENFRIDVIQNYLSDAPIPMDELRNYFHAIRHWFLLPTTPADKHTAT
ncbi:MAG: hypothetical protein WBV94_18570 [Blastocatellia bacterium]